MFMLPVRSLDSNRNGPDDRLIAKLNVLTCHDNVSFINLQKWLGDTTEVRDTSEPIIWAIAI